MKCESKYNNSFLFLWTALMAFALCLPSQLRGAAFTEEGFNYPVGSNLGTNSPWLGGASTALAIVTNNLSYANLRGIYPQGNTFRVAGGKSANAYRNFTSSPITNGVLYWSTLINCSVLPTNSQFMACILSSASSSPNQPDDPLDFFVKSVTNGYSFSIGHTGNDPVSTTNILTTNTTHLIVLKYTFGNGDRVSLFIDPVPGGTEPATPNVATQNGEGTAASNLQKIYFRASSSAAQGVWSFDTFRFGTNWSDVTPLPIPLSVSGPQNQAVCYGSPVTFSATASGTPPFTYAWRTNGVPIAKATNSTYLLANPTAVDALKQFDVVVNDAFGSITSLVAHITFSTNAPSIFSQPQSQVVQPTDTSVTFTIGAIGDAPMSFQWRSNGIVIPNETNTTLVIHNPSPNNSAVSYDVVVVNPCGSLTSSPPVSLLYPHAFYDGYDSGPGFFGGKNLIVTNSGGIPMKTYSSASLHLPITGWQLEGAMDEFLLHDAASNSRYSITVTPATSPMYYIFGTSLAWPYLNPIPVVIINTDVDGNYIVTKTTQFINDAGVLSDPVPPGIVQNPANQAVWPGSNATFTVVVSGSGPLNYQWYFNSNAIPSANLPSLTLANVAATNAGQYQVVVSSDYGSVTSSIATLGVITPFYYAYDAGAGFFGGENLFFTNNSGQVMQAWSSPTLDISVTNWTLEGIMDEFQFHDADMTSRYTINLTPATSPVYYIFGPSITPPYPQIIPLQRITTDIDGNYYTFNTNAFISSEGFISFPAAPSITTQPSPLTVLAGNTVEFDVTATGTSPLFYQWYSPASTAIPAATNASLIISNLSTAQAGNYTVIVSNLFGTATSQPALLNVIPKPKLNSQKLAGAFTLNSVGVPGDVYWVMASSNLVPNSTWIPIATNLVASNGVISFVDTNTAGWPQKFYRLQFPSLFQTAPLIVQQPASSSVLLGGSLNLNVTAAGKGPLTYQWYDSANSPVANATTASLALSGLGTGSKNYKVVVNNSYGSVTSSIASVIVLPLPKLLGNLISSKMKLSAQVVPGNNYLLQSCTNLTPPIQWTTIMSNSADSSGNVSFTDTNTATQSKFYRLVAP